MTVLALMAFVRSQRQAVFSKRRQRLNMKCRRSSLGKTPTFAKTSTLSKISQYLPTSLRNLNKCAAKISGSARESVKYLSAVPAQEVKPAVIKLPENQARFSNWHVLVKRQKIQ